jgi:hypothetical protein
LLDITLIDFCILFIIISRNEILILNTEGWIAQWGNNYQSDSLSAKEKKCNESHIILRDRQSL